MNTDISLRHCALSVSTFKTEASPQKKTKMHEANDSEEVPSLCLFYRKICARDSDGNTGGIAE